MGVVIACVCVSRTRVGVLVRCFGIPRGSSDLVTQERQPRFSTLSRVTVYIDHETTRKIITASVLPDDGRGTVVDFFHPFSVCSTCASFCSFLLFFVFTYVFM